MKLLNAPDDGILIGKVSNDADTAFKTRTIDIAGDRNNNLDIIGNAPGFELRSRFDHILDPGALMRFDNGFDPDQGLDMSGEAVGHEIEFTVGWDEAYGTIVFETSESHALMEFDILQLDGFSGTRLIYPSRGLEHEFIVETEFELGHATQKAFHFDGAEDFAVEDVAVGADEEVEFFHHVQENFVLFVFDAFGAPADGVGEGHGWFGAEILGHAIAFLGDEASEDGGVKTLGEAMVHGLVQQFVDANEVIADALFF